MAVCAGEELDVLPLHLGPLDVVVALLGLPGDGEACGRSGTAGLDTGLAGSGFNVSGFAKRLS